MDVLSYGRHSALGRDLEVPEERMPPKHYRGNHAADRFKGHCDMPPDECGYVCPKCLFHMCMCGGWSDED